MQGEHHADDDPGKHGAADAARLSQLRRPATGQPPFLLTLGDALRSVRDRREAIAVAMRLVGEERDVDRVVYLERSDTSDEAVFVAGQSHTSSRASAIDLPYTVTVPEAPREGVGSGGTVVIADTRTRPPEEVAPLMALGVRAYIGVPVVRNGCMVASLGVHHVQPRAWTRAEIECFEEVAERLQDALDRIDADAASTARASTATQRARMFEATLSILSDFACVFTADGHLVFANEALLSVWEQPLAQVTGKLPAELPWSREGATCLHEQIEHAVTHHEKISAEIRLDGADENARGHTCICAPVVNAEGAVEAVAIRISPMRGDESRKPQSPHPPEPEPALVATTEQAPAESASNLPADRYKILSQAIDQALMLAELVRDASGQAIDWRVLELNPAFSHLFEIPVAEAAGRLASEVFPREGPSWTRALDRIMRTGKSERVEQGLDGARSRRGMQVCPLGHDQFLGLYQDVAGRDPSVDAPAERQPRGAFTLQLVDAMHGEARPEDIGALATRMIAQHLALDRCWIASRGNRDDIFRIGPEHHAEVLAPVGGEYPLTGIPESMGRAADEPFVVHDAARDSTLSEHDKAAFAAMDTGACMVTRAPQSDNDGGWWLCASTRTPRDWTASERQLLKDATRRIRHAMERACAAAMLETRQTALQRQSERFEATLCAISEFACGFDLQGRITYANERLLQWWGRSLEQVAGRNIFELGYDQDKAEKLQHQIRQVIETGQVVRDEAARDTDSGIRYHQYVLVPVQDNNGSLVAVAGSGRDTTADKTAQIGTHTREKHQAFVLTFSDTLRKLRDAHAIGTAATRTLARHLGTGRCLIAQLPHGKDPARVEAEYCRQDLSPVFNHEDTLPWSLFREPAEPPATRPLVIGDIHGEAAFPESKTRFVHQLQGMEAFIAVPLRHGTEQACWIMIAGSARPRQWTVEEVQLVEQIAERTCAMMDRARAQEALRASEAKLQRANRAKDDFIAMLSHELRNPLAPIASTLQLMRLRAPDVLAKERGIIEAQMRDITGLVDDLLDISRIARGKVQLDREPLDVEQLVEAAVQSTRTTMEQRQQTLHVNVEKALTICGDRRRMVQVLVNLLGNAAKYSAPGRNVLLAATCEDGEAVVRVCDEGRGIPPELLPHMFELFRQQEQTSEQAQSGLGLGLAIVRDLVELHGGRVTADSDGPGKGSEFTVYLPLLDGDQTRRQDTDHDRATTPEPGETTSKARILVVDDYTQAADTMGELLQAMGYRTRVAHDGAEALAVLADFQPQLALIDIGLPGMDGYELARRIRRMPGCASLPLVALTGYGQPADRQRVAEAGFAEHLVKPLNATHIGELIEQFL